jgi:hypothetical protein
MIEEWYTLSCDDCAKAFSLFPVKGDTFSSYPAQELMKTAEKMGWKVNRIVRDVYYGKAWCPECRKVTC